MNSYLSILNAVKEYNIEKAINLLQSNIIEENTRKASKGRGAGSDIARLKIINGYLKTATYNESMRKAHLQKNGNYIFTEGHILFVSSHDFGIENEDQGRAYKFDAFFQDVSTDDFITLNPAEIKSFIALTGATRKARRYNLKPYYAKSQKGVVIAFNPFFALDSIQYADTTKFYVTRKNAPIYAENMSCLFLPINSDDIDFDAWHAETFKAAGDAAAV